MSEEHRTPLRAMTVTLTGHELCRLVQIYAAQRLAKVGRPDADSNFRLVPIKDFHNLSPSASFVRDVIEGHDLFVGKAKQVWKQKDG